MKFLWQNLLMAFLVLSVIQPEVAEGIRLNFPKYKPSQPAAVVNSSGLSQMQGSGSSRVADIPNTSMASDALLTVNGVTVTQPSVQSASIAGAKDSPLTWSQCEAQLNACQTAADRARRVASSDKTITQASEINWTFIFDRVHCGTNQPYIKSWLRWEYARAVKGGEILTRRKLIAIANKYQVISLLYDLTPESVGPSVLTVNGVTVNRPKVTDETIAGAKDSPLTWSSCEEQLNTCQTVADRTKRVASSDTTIDKASEINWTFILDRVMCAANLEYVKSWLRWEYAQASAGNEASTCARLAALNFSQTIGTNPLVDLIPTLIVNRVTVTQPIVQPGTIAGAQGSRLTWSQCEEQLNAYQTAADRAKRVASSTLNVTNPGQINWNFMLQSVRSGANLEYVKSWLRWEYAKAFAGNETDTCNKLATIAEQNKVTDSFADLIPKPVVTAPVIAAPVTTVWDAPTQSSLASVASDTNMYNRAAAVYKVFVNAENLDVGYDSATPRDQESLAPTLAQFASALATTIGGVTYSSISNTIRPMSWANPSQVIQDSIAVFNYIAPSASGTTAPSTSTVSVNVQSAAFLVHDLKLATPPPSAANDAKTFMASIVTALTAADALWAAPAKTALTAETTDDLYNRAKDVYAMFVSPLNDNVGYNSVTITPPTTGGFVSMTTFAADLAKKIGGTYSATTGTITIPAPTSGASSINPDLGIAFNYIPKPGTSAPTNGLAQVIVQNAAFLVSDLNQITPPATVPDATVQKKIDLMNSIVAALKASVWTAPTLTSNTTYQSRAAAVYSVFVNSGNKNVGTDVASKLLTDDSGNFSTMAHFSSDLAEKINGTGYKLPNDNKIVSVAGVNPDLIAVFNYQASNTAVPINVQSAAFLVYDLQQSPPDTTKALTFMNAIVTALQAADLWNAPTQPTTSSVDSAVWSRAALVYKMFVNSQNVGVDALLKPASQLNLTLQNFARTLATKINGGSCSEPTYTITPTSGTTLSPQIQDYVTAFNYSVPSFTGPVPGNVQAAAFLINDLKLITAAPYTVSETVKKNALDLMNNIVLSLAAVTGAAGSQNQQQQQQAVAAKETDAQMMARILKGFYKTAQDAYNYNYDGSMPEEFFWKQVNNLKTSNAISAEQPVLAKISNPITITLQTTAIYTALSASPQENAAIVTACQNLITQPAIPALSPAATPAAGGDSISSNNGTPQSNMNAQNSDAQINAMATTIKLAFGNADVNAKKIGLTMATAKGFWSQFDTTDRPAAIKANAFYKDALNKINRAHTDILFDILRQDTTTILQTSIDEQVLSVCTDIFNSKTPKTVEQLNAYQAAAAQAAMPKTLQGLISGATPRDTAPNFCNSLNNLRTTNSRTSNPSNYAALQLLPANLIATDPTMQTLFGLVSQPLSANLTQPMIDAQVLAACTDIVNHKTPQTLAQIKAAKIAVDQAAAAVLVNAQKAKDMLALILKLWPTAPATLASTDFVDGTTDYSPSVSETQSFGALTKLPGYSWTAISNAIKTSGDTRSAAITKCLQDLYK